MILRYGFYGEDAAQLLFLHHYLQVVSAELAYKFELDVHFVTQYQRRHGIKLMTKREVNKLYADACQQGLTDFQHDCFFVCRDLDDFRPVAFQQENREMLATMHADLGNYAPKAILMLPVQCIEHWLWHLKWRLEHPGSTKNMPLETQPRPEAKLAVYNAKKCSTKHSNPIVEQLAASMDPDWLASRSTSFLAFHTQVQAYLDTLPAA